MYNSRTFSQNYQLLFENEFIVRFRKIIPKISSQLKVIVRLLKVLTQNEELEALFYVALLILTLITLALALVLRESPQF